MAENEVKILFTSKSTGLPVVIEIWPGLFNAFVQQIHLEQENPETDEVLFYFPMIICVFPMYIHIFPML